ncbi:MAG: hypothetical protein KIS81_10115 [Maricaulaceae bacterium]|nr:hypothetical protein [Maricaulaceae bacterium]
MRILYVSLAAGGCALSLAACATTSGETAAIETAQAGEAAAAEDAATPAAADGEEVVCTEERVTGGLIARRRLCMTEDQRQRVRDAWRRWHRDFDRGTLGRGG